MSARASSQAPPGTVAGTVRDEAGRPLPAANVVLDPDRTPRFAVTNAEGRFRFTGVPRGQHALRVLRLGFRAEDRVINMGSAGAELTIVLRRITTALDTLRVVARRTGLFGTVIDRAELRPVAFANVHVGTTRHAARTGADGRFDFPALLSGAYVVFAGGAGVGDALRYSLSFLRKGLVPDDRKACVFINGLPAPNTTANDVHVADVEAIEVYGLRADYTNTLSRRWPRYTSCGSSRPLDCKAVSTVARRRIPLSGPLSSGSSADDTPCDPPLYSLDSAGTLVDRPL